MKCFIDKNTKCPHCWEPPRIAVLFCMHNKDRQEAICGQEYLVGPVEAPNWCPLKKEANN